MNFKDFEKCGKIKIKSDRIETMLKWEAEHLGFLNFKGLSSIEVCTFEKQQEFLSN